MWLLLLFLSWVNLATAGETRVVDDFEDLTGWQMITSEGVDLEIAQDKGHTGMGMRLDFDFHEHNGGGFVLARKVVSLPLTENYAFSFYVRANAPTNNFEYKLVDPNQNVWWFNQRYYQFPDQWQKVTVKKRHIDFAWGPSGGTELREVAAIEFAISAGNGGKGSVWIDELTLERRAPLRAAHLPPIAQASTTAAGFEPASVFDQNPATSWKSGSIAEGQWLLIDFQEVREYGGLIIDWDSDDYAEVYEVQVSDDGEKWQRSYSVATSNGGRDYISLPDSESRYLRIDLQRSSRGQGYGIKAIDIKPYQFSSSPNQLFKAIASDSFRGAYPKYLAGEQSYWTVVGVSGDSKEALINEQGMVEVDKGTFSIEPFLYLDGKLVTWNDVSTKQKLEKNYLPIPSVTWDYPGVKLTVTALAAGKPKASSLYLRYRVDNTTNQPLRGKLFLAIRPFQVNPPWQSLNMIGGVGKIKELHNGGQSIKVNKEKSIVTLTPSDRFGAVIFSRGDITDYLAEGLLPKQTAIIDPFGYGSGALEYNLDLSPGGAREIYLLAPFHRASPGVAEHLTAQTVSELWTEAFNQTRDYWDAQINRVEFQLPPSASKIAQTLKTTQAYILINQDGPALQPGSRAYERSWIRDGAIISTALMNMGHTKEVRDFIEWYANYQLPSGKIPCCVDKRGPDPVPEHDSLGQWIYLIMEYYRFSHDTGFLTELWPSVVKTVAYIDALRQECLTADYRLPQKTVLYGLMPASISHEGYASNPVHSYWDDFFTLRGLKDATNIAHILGEQAREQEFKQLRDEFKRDLHASIRRSITLHGINFIPGAAELGDFDPTATTIGIDPGGELNDLPQEALRKTFDKYYEILMQRTQRDNNWNAYSPYELRIMSSFIRLGLKEHAHEALKFFFNSQRPASWNHWGEIVLRDRNAPGFIGDLPHTWVGADFLRAIRTLFAYEREADQALVIAAGIPSEWVTNDQVIGVKRLPTYYGTLNYSLKPREEGGLKLTLSGDITLPPGKLVVYSPLKTPLKSVSVNGHPIENFKRNQVTIDEFPAEVILQ